MFSECSWEYMVFGWFDSGTAQADLSAFLVAEYFLEKVTTRKT